ncbi:putative cation-transporting atpase 4 [Erysiphe necator]|uniref:Putative cation-transporting atpase 4 n=1 Tax=Uncinula necator TaxID=52586 RepID=A0A0B1P8V6_UNCNE|nr:putative cation-transporting atpase 4 [Erysiphe necator]
MAPLVDSCLIKHAALRNPLPVYLHTYVWPFAIIWPIFFHYYLSTELYDTYIGGQEWTFFWSGLIITLQSLVWLSTHWNVNLRSLFTTISAKYILDAQEIKVIPISNSGASDICGISKDNVGGEQNISFLFQKRRYQYNFEKKSFLPLIHRVDDEPKPLIEYFQKSQGLVTAADIDRIQRYYGDNTFDIPIPTFSELFKEHAVAPFFVFQVFCVGLWMLDEYWYYSIFTLFMLVIFESTVVWQRQRTLNEFRGMSIKPYDIWVFRKNKWEEIRSNKLLPGDLVSVGRTKEDSGVACDMLLVQGSAIVNEAMLSGESTPLLKDSILLRPPNARLEPLGLDKNSFLYGGTKVLQITHTNNEEKPKLLSGVPTPPDNGAMAVVTKTGFETSQGSLVRTMIYSTERVSANNAEALLFILFLLIFAIAASWYVWDEGVKKDRKRSKLMLDCILIITSVVPPELPMELSLAVNTSLAALSRYAIYCTEPFRIPFAGRVDVACFDKTGTLTGEDLVVEGIAGLELSETGSGQKLQTNSANIHIIPVAQASMETILVLATAHAVVKLDEGDIVGDPMEKATLTSIGWTLGKNDTLSCQKSTTADSLNALNSVQIKRRFQFSSALKRQSSIAIITNQNPGSNKKIRSTFLGVKGAPETIMKMLIKIPTNYEETYKHFTRKGSRVLALAFKFLATDSELSIGKINELKREEAESELHFAGFLVLHCPLKEDAKKSIQMLNESSHRVVMITGDSPLTACHVAYEVDIIDRNVLILDAPDHDGNGEDLVWKDINDTISISVNPNRPIDPEIIANNDLCITGYALAKFSDKEILKTIYRNSWVYARVSPKQKEEILMGLKNLGYYTLMAGDGTNDVGALKQAHIGVALLNGSQDDLNRIAEHFKLTKLKELYEKQCQVLKRFDRPNPSVPIAIAHLYPPGPINPHYSAAMAREAEKKNSNPLKNTATQTSSKEVGLSTISNKNSLINSRRSKGQDMPTQASSLAEKFSQSMMDQELDDEPPIIKLGDASVAAPFTSKLSNVIAIPNIIRQGRCTLVATIQMYKILALNCLISAYSLSVLYLEGIKFGDGQVTISGMLMSVCFLSISRAKSVEGLSKERPQPNIFNFYIIGSILGQFAIHITTLIYIARFCDRLSPREGGVVDLEGDFSPSLLNSAVYLLQLIQQISTFAINYQGRPFRESLSENRGMYWGIIGVSCIAFSCSTEFIPEINEKMRLVPFSTEFKLTMTATMIVDYLGCWVVEKILKLVFSDYKPKDIAVRRPDQIEREKKRREADHRNQISSEEEISQAAVEELEKKLAQKKKIR